jgi:hypothetical protein
MRVTDQLVSTEDARTNLRLRAAGLAAIAAAALGSVVATSEAAPITDRTCVSVLAGAASSDDCAASTAP